MAHEKNTEALPFGGHCDHCGEMAGQRQRGSLRCACGSLLARYVESGIELKCRRCKRTVIVVAAAALEDSTG